MIIVGCDPGLQGGIVVMQDGQVIKAIPMPVAGGIVDGRQVHDELAFLCGGDAPIAYIEKVSSRPGQGVASMFKFGKGVGIVMGVLWAMGIPIREVTPQAWKKEVLAGTAKDKEAAIEYCRRVRPYVNIIPEGHRTPHDGIADAICIAEYGMRKEG